MKTKSLESCVQDVVRALEKPSSPWKVAVSAFHASEEIHVGPTSRLYEIGSVTKVFTAILLAKAAQDGLLRLDESLSSSLKIQLNPDIKLTPGHPH